MVLALAEPVADRQAQLAYRKPARLFYPAHFDQLSRRNCGRLYPARAVSQLYAARHLWSAGCPRRQVLACQSTRPPAGFGTHLCKIRTGRLEPFRKPLARMAKRAQQVTEQCASVPLRRSQAHHYAGTEKPPG